MEWTPVCLECIQLLNSTFHRLPALAFEILGPHVRDIIASRIVLVALVSWKRSTKSPGHPSTRAPTVPNRWLHVVRSAIPLLEEHSAILVIFFCYTRQAEVVRTWESKVAKHKAANGEDRREHFRVCRRRGVVTSFRAL